MSAVTLMILGPTVWVKVLGHAEAIFPYEYPALFSHGARLRRDLVLLGDRQVPERLRRAC